MTDVPEIPHHRIKFQNNSTKRTTPLLALIYRAYQDKFPYHRGKQRLSSLMRKHLAQSQSPFLWRMKNGLYVAIAKADIGAGCGVGWTCFEYGIWEEHIEKCLVSLLKKGSIALDIGANIGYFSASMARKVEMEGQIFAFEPVPTTREQLQLTKEVNNLSNLNIFPFAIGKNDSSATIKYNPAISGNASLYDRSSNEEYTEVEVRIRSLDSLFQEQLIPAADLIKIDIEGHEFDAICGGRSYITSCKPAIIIEYNPETAKLAGWHLSDMITKLEEYCEYKFFILQKNGSRLPLDLNSIAIPLGDYVDILALPAHFSSLII